MNIGDSKACVECGQVLIRGKCPDKCKPVRKSLSKGGSQGLGRVNSLSKRGADAFSFDVVSSNA